MTSTIARSGARSAVHALGDNLKRVDVKTRIGLIEYRERRLQHQHLQDLVALFFAAGEALVDAAAQERLVIFISSSSRLHERKEFECVDLGLARGLAHRVQRGLSR